jgi:hypothetical protein
LACEQAEAAGIVQLNEGAQWETWLGHPPKNAQQVIEWLEQTVTGWNKQPTPFVWNGKRRRRRERARIRRLAGSGAAVVKGYAIDK